MTNANAQPEIPSPEARKTVPEKKAPLGSGTLAVFIIVLGAAAGLLW
jgi:hypothetical protein